MKSSHFYPFLRLTLLGAAFFVVLLASPAFAQTTNTWTGSTSTDWNTATNWSRARVPLATDDAVIAASPANQPVIGAGTAAGANSMEVLSGASLGVVSGASLTLNGSKSVAVGRTTFTTAFCNRGCNYQSGPNVK